MWRTMVNRALAKTGVQEILIEINEMVWEFKNALW